MDNHNEIKLFEGKKVRSVWNANSGEWYFPVIDVVAVLTDNVDSGAYWRKLKQRLIAEGSQVVTFCHELNFFANETVSKYWL